MKRTAEITLVIIALVLQLLVTIIVVTFLAFFNSQFPEIVSPKFESWYAWFVVIVHVAGFLLGIISLVMLKDKPKLSGIILIVTSVIMLLLTLGATFIQSTLLIIAGVMYLTRKQKNLSNRIY